MADSLMVVEMSTAATAMDASPSRDPGGPVHHEEEWLRVSAVTTRPRRCAPTALGHQLGSRRPELDVEDTGRFLRRVPDGGLGVGLGEVLIGLGLGLHLVGLGRSRGGAAGDEVSTSLI